MTTETQAQVEAQAAPSLEARMAGIEGQQTLIIALMRSHDANIGVMDAKFEAKFNRDGRADGRNGSAHR